MVPPHTTQVVLLKCRLFGVACWGHIPHTVQYMEMDSVYSCLQEYILYASPHTEAYSIYLLYMDIFSAYNSVYGIIFPIQFQMQKYIPYTRPDKEMVSAYNSEEGVYSVCNSVYRNIFVHKSVCCNIFRREFCIRRINILDTSAYGDICRMESLMRKYIPCRFPYM